MDTYEKMRRMAEMSKTLKQHGLVKDSYEGLQQADASLPGKSLTKTYDLSSEDSPVNRQEFPQVKAGTIDKFTERIDAVEATIDIVRDKMNEIIAKINELESKVAYSQRQEVQATLVAPKKQELKPEASRPITSAPPKKEEDYTGSEVAIDKIFYVGKK